nr:hypothetical protein BaRGS_023579 [Batillaria attramentaria]
MAIFVLPLNSALNPFLYTLNIAIERRRKKTMDAENEHFRFYTFMRLKLGDNGKKILQVLQAVLGAKCVAPNRWNLKDLNAA